MGCSITGRNQNASFWQMHMEGLSEMCFCFWEERLNGEYSKDAETDYPDQGMPRTAATSQGKWHSLRLR